MVLEQEKRTSSAVAVDLSTLLAFRALKYAEIGRRVSKEVPGSIEWMGGAGKFWWEAREASNLTRNEIAQKMGIDIKSVACVELGVGYPELNLIDKAGNLDPGGVARSEFPRRYAEALGKPELYSEFRERFNLPAVISSQT